MAQHNKVRQLYQKRGQVVCSRRFSLIKIRQQWFNIELKVLIHHEPKRTHKVHHHPTLRESLRCFFVSESFLVHIESFLFYVYCWFYFPSWFICLFVLCFVLILSAFLCHQSQPFFCQLLLSNAFFSRPAMPIDTCSLLHMPLPFLATVHTVAKSPFPLQWRTCALTHVFSPALICKQLLQYQYIFMFKSLLGLLLHVTL